MARGGPQGALTAPWDGPEPFWTLTGGPRPRTGRWRVLTAVC